MFGTNPKRPPLKHHDGQSLDVVEIFPTIQGEGLFAGHPAIFIRLGGCNLACDFCDTEFEAFEPMALEAVVGKVQGFCNENGRGQQAERAVSTRSAAPCESQETFTGAKLIVITGGEPLRQNIAPLCEALIAQGFEVQIETNGTLYQDLPEAVNIVCSPKTTGAEYAPIRPDMLARADALKFIISKTHPHYQQVAGWCAWSNSLPPIYVQPMDEQDEQKNHDNTQYAVELAKAHGYRLSLQLHKLLNIP